MAEKFCLVAGSGDLVTQIVAAALARGVDLEVLTVTGRTDLKGVAVTDFAPDALDGLFAAIRDRGIAHVLLAGYVAPPTWKALQNHPALGFAPTDAPGTAELARRLEAALPGLTGARLIGIHQLAPDLIATAGPIAGPALSEASAAAAREALLKARELGWRDIGQAVLVSRDGRVEAEDAAGTDALLARIAGDGTAGPGWILAKALKPRQPITMDLPVIGPATIENARRAGVGIIAIEAGTIVVDRPLVAQAADAAGISVVGIALGPVTVS